MPRAVRKQPFATDFATKREFADVHDEVETTAALYVHMIEFAESSDAHSSVTFLPASTTTFFGVFVSAEREPASLHHYYYIEKLHIVYLHLYKPML